MKICRSEGELRAYLDRELPPPEMEAVEKHLAGCEACGAELAELARRSQRISALMDELPLEAASALSAPAHPWRWAAGLALAAGLAIAYIVFPQRAAQNGEKTGAPVGDLSHNVANQVPELSPMKLATAPLPPPSPRPKQARQQPPKHEYFFALDDDPIEFGVVQRVALGPAGVPANVIFSPDGRARAISLVSNASYGGDRQ